MKWVLCYLEKLSKLLGSSFCRWSSSISLTTSAAGGQVFAIFCSNAIVVLVLNRPTARRLRPCKRHASTDAMNNRKTMKIFQQRWTIQTAKSCNTTIFFMNAFFRHGFFHHLFDLDRRKSIEGNNKKFNQTSRLTFHNNFWRICSCSRNYSLAFFLSMQLRRKSFTVDLDFSFHWFIHEFFQNHK